MPRRIAVVAIVALLSLAMLRAPAPAQDSDAGGQWERVEPGEPAPAAPEAPGGQMRQIPPMPPKVCAGLASAVGQLAMLRDRGVPKEQLMQSAASEGAGGNVQGYVRGYIDYVYDHREYDRGQIEEQVKGSCSAHR